MMDTNIYCPACGLKRTDCPACNPIIATDKGSQSFNVFLPYRKVTKWIGKYKTEEFV